MLRWGPINVHIGTGMNLLQESYKQHWVKHVVSLAVVPLLFFSSPKTAVTDTSWQVSTGGWSTAANWTNGEPDETVTARIDNGGTARITELSEQAYMVVLGGTNDGALEISSGSLGVPNWLYVGGSGTDVVTQTGGTIASTFMRLGEYADGEGTYNLLDGSLNVGSTHVGCEGQGTFNQHGGLHSVDGFLAIGTLAGGKGDYLITGGELEVSDGTIFLGGSLLDSDLTILGGVVIVDEVSYGGGGALLLGPSGTLRVNSFSPPEAEEVYGGTLQLGHSSGLGDSTYICTRSLTVERKLVVGYDADYSFYLDGGDLLCDSLGIGQNAGGIFNHNSGTNEIWDRLLLGCNPSGGWNYYNLSGGELKTTNADSKQYIGYGGHAILMQTGGTNRCAWNTYVGGYEGSSGIYALYAGTDSIGCLLYIGYRPDSKGVYLIDDATSLVERHEVIGHCGGGVLIQWNGFHRVAGNMVIGYTDPITQGAGTYYLDGGEFEMTGGDLNVVSGAFRQAAGECSVSMNVGWYPSASGASRASYAWDAGSLSGMVGS